jgi:hypothetical protein
MKIIVIAFAIATVAGIASIRSNDDELSITPSVPQFCTMPELSESVERAHAVFLGEVVEITPPGSQPVEARLRDAYTIKFKVEKSWKGTKPRHYFSVSSDHGARQAFAFPVVHLGEKYLVFADPLYFDGVPQKKWSGISACNRTKILSKASEDLRRLDSGYAPSKAKIRGKRSSYLSR